MHLLPHDVPKQYIERGTVKQIDILCRMFANGQFDVALLILSPDSKIAEHHHTDDIEYYFNLMDWSLIPCGIGESHSLENTSQTEDMRVLSIKVRKFKTSDKS